MSMTLQTNDLFILIFLDKLHRELVPGVDLATAMRRAIVETFKFVRGWNESNFEENLHDAVKQLTDEFFKEL